MIASRSDRPNQTLVKQKYSAVDINAADTHEENIHFKVHFCIDEQFSSHTAINDRVNIILCVV